MNGEITKTLTRMVLYVGIIVLCNVSGAGGGLLGRGFSWLFLSKKPDKPAFGGENLSISISRKWLVWGFTIAGAGIAALLVGLLLIAAVRKQLPGYL